MSTFCSNHQLISSKKHHHSFKELDLPPRREQHQFLLQQQDMSPPPYDKTLNLDEDPIISDDEDELDPYSSDYFRMYEFKVRRCTRRRSHDWTDCPFAHPGEKARRRDPKRYCYSGSVCPDFRRGGCSLGDSCEFAHGVFECWLHPSRYRTEACKDGKKCNRKVCFFAHTPRQLRIPCRVSGNHSSPCCCLVGHSVSSPTSTLIGMSHVSPPMSPSPPLSPARQRSLSGFSQASRCSDRMLRSGSGGVVSYKDVLSELMSSLEAMNFDNKATSICFPSSSGRITRANSNSNWVDASFVDDQQFILSPSTPSRSGSGNLFEGSYFSRNNRGVGGLDEKKMMNENGRWFGTADPDLGWVNDLLM